MTATPIPRTLHMAMLGIRDLCVIQTPPVDRQAIRTYVAHFDDGLIREVILRELNRGGQVFFVHNRVENIEYIARHLRALVPEAKVAVAHGQMNERQLEQVMRDFIENRVNVLVCSAIIESGLDIPNANTIIINRADHFGLAQLYQLRGRVGRSRQKAYAYLLIPGEHIITRDAKQRIEALRELVETERRRLQARDARPRASRRRQSARPRAIRPNHRGRLRAVHRDDGAGDPRTARRAAAARLRARTPARHPGLYPRQLRAGRERAAGALSADGAGGFQSDLDELRDEMRDRFGPVPTLVDNLLPR